MFRSALFLILLVSASRLMAAPASLNVQVISVEIGLHDYEDRPTLCLTIARELKSGLLVGLIEDITDCFWARQANRSPEKILRLPKNYLSPVKQGQMLNHLQAFDSQLEFFWSNAD